MFFRSGQGGSGKADLWSVDLTGVNERKVPTLLDGSDPNRGLRSALTGEHIGAVPCATI